MKISVDIDDWQQICALKARYCRFMDTKQWDAWRELFTEDYEMDVSCDTGMEPIKGRDAAVDFVISRIEHTTTAHHVHMPEITIDDDRAEVIWAMQDRLIQVSAGLSITGYGHYHDKLARVDGEWKIAALRLSRLHIDVLPLPDQPEET